MTYLSVTRFRLRSGNPVGLALFFWHTLRSGRQAERSPGFLGGKMLVAAKQTYWTLTVWQDEAGMKAYRTTGNHRAALRGMKLLDRFCSEAVTFGRPHTGLELPESDSLLDELNMSGRFFALSRPSAAHRDRALQSAPIRVAQILKPHVCPEAAAQRSLS
ncbi:hypothetical protein BH24DEI2_BH24DEI2_04400 [soil metagenome]